MDDSELRSKVGAILRQEERQAVDWGLVRSLRDALDEGLTAQSYIGCPDVVRHFLCDDDIRERDTAYGESQRKAVRHYVRTGEYRDITTIPGWSCLLVIAAIVALLVWLL